MAKEVQEEVQRWTAKRRAALVVSILKGETSVVEAARKHGLTVAEVEDRKEPFMLAAENALRILGSTTTTGGLRWGEHYSPPKDPIPGEIAQRASSPRRSWPCLRGNVARFALACGEDAYSYPAGNLNSAPWRSGVM